MATTFEAISEKCFIGGEWVQADSGARFDVTDPATDEVVGSVPECGDGETARAIEAAHSAFKTWSRTTAGERAKVLRKLYELTMRDQDRLAELMTREQGKPLSESKGEIAYAASFIEWAGEEAKRVYGDIVPASSVDKRILVLRQAVGVAGIVTPWNFPAAMITRKLGPALAAGCTAVIKPAEQTPLSALALGRLCVEAGVPAGVVNIVTGDPKAIGGELMSNPRVATLSFTGSTEVGKVLIKQSAENVMRLSLELGGHAPFLVFDDADVEAAVKGAVASKYRNAGQTCICANRFYVQRGVYDQFVEKLGVGVGGLRVGRGLDEGVDVGPLIDDAGMEKVERHVADARSKGGEVVRGGAPAELSGLSKRFYQPTVIAGMSPEMTIASEETFGPVAPVRVFDEEDEAVAMANNSVFGLAAYFFTRDASRLIRVAEGLEYGIVGANDGGPSTVQAPFGGVKQSGWGREGGKYVMDEYTEIKYVSWGL